MSNRSFIVLAAAVLVLGAFIWFFERHEPTTDEAEQQENKVFSNLTADDIQGLEVRNAHGLFDFTRDTRGGWRLTAPLEGAADAFAVDGVISSVIDLEVDRTLGRRRGRRGCVRSRGARAGRHASRQRGHASNC